MEGIVSWEYFLQLNQAKARHNALQPSASEREAYPNGRETIKTAGLKMNATISKATVVVYRVPVDLNKATSSGLSSVPKRRGRTV
jgi:hypothetical protein